jgi:hypothetical protein
MIPVLKIPFSDFVEQICHQQSHAPTLSSASGLGTISGFGNQKIRVDWKSTAHQLFNELLFVFSA